MYTDNADGVTNSVSDVDGVNLVLGKTDYY